MTKMKKITKLKICDWALLALTVAVLVSSVLLEVFHGRGFCRVWTHIILGMAFTAVVVWHIYLHFGWRSWVNRLRGQKSAVTRWMSVLGALTLLGAIVASVHWLGAYTHSPAGGLHGKIGLLFLALALWHTAKRARFLCT